MALIGLSVWGVFSDPYSAYRQRNHLQPPSELYKRLDESYARNSLSRQFVSDLNRELPASFRYEWPDDVDYMPVQENWILWLLKIADPLLSKAFGKPESKHFSKLELPEYSRAVSRGFGICSQMSLALADLLHKRYGIDARVAGLGGHVVVQIVGEPDDSWLIDPAYSTFTKGSVLKVGSVSAEFLTRRGSNPNQNAGAVHLSERSGWGPYSPQSAGKQLLLFRAVILSYYLKWLLPAASVFLSILYLVRRRRRPPCAA